MVDDCQLCNAVRDATRPNGPSFHGNTPLAESPNFLVLPCIGPLLSGHVIVVSRDHYPSLASMGSDAISEYNQLVHEIVRKPDGWLEAEHGATNSDCAGSCVVHTHIHLIPTMAKFSEVLDGAYQQLYRGSSLELPSETVPYVFLRASLDEARVVLGEGLPSQLIRQAICGATGREDWDWRSVPRSHLIDETLKFWGEMT